MFVKVVKTKLVCNIELKYPNKFTYVLSLAQL